FFFFVVLGGLLIDWSSLRQVRVPLMCGCGCDCRVYRSGRSGVFRRGPLLGAGVGAGRCGSATGSAWHG
ncbi:hypothetical protein, partial [Escherichia coli]|uniref:hypothetical protein n=1 Tax=Escherichia coli TaxID=562 RepID=UPI001BB0CDE9